MEQGDSLENDDQLNIQSQPDEVLQSDPDTNASASDAIITRIDKTSIHKICAGQVILDLANVAKVRLNQS